VSGLHSQCRFDYNPAGESAAVGARCLWIVNCESDPPATARWY
jgi:hypothetical protein